MSCCLEFDQAFEEGVIRWVPPHEINDGPMMNQIISEYFLSKAREGGYSYYALNYCPFSAIPPPLPNQSTRPLYDRKQFRLVCPLSLYTLPLEVVGDRYDLLDSKVPVIARDLRLASRVDHNHPARCGIGHLHLYSIIYCVTSQVTKLQF